MFICLIIIGSILVTCLIFAFIYFVDLLIDWSTKKSNKLKIKLEQFKLFYSINPNVWELRDDYVIYNVFNKDGYATKSFKFYFPFLDFIKYKIFKKRLDKKSTQVKYSELYLEALEYIKKDIDKFTTDNNDFVNEQLKKITK